MQSRKGKPLSCGNVSLFLLPAPRYMAMTALMPIPKPIAVALIKFCTGNTSESDVIASSALSALHGIVLMIICILIMPAFLSMFTSNKNVIDLGNVSLFLSACTKIYGNDRIDADTKADSSGTYKILHWEHHFSPHSKQAVRLFFCPQTKGV